MSRPLPRCIAQVTVCSAGLYANGFLVTSGVGASLAWPAPVCAACPLGSVAPHDGAVYCTPCATNTFAVGDGVSCAACPANAVSPPGAGSAADCVCQVSACLP